MESTTFFKCGSLSEAQNIGYRVFQVCSVTTE
jgi:hypothetical protein